MNQLYEFNERKNSQNKNTKENYELNNLFKNNHSINQQNSNNFNNDTNTEFNNINNTWHK